MAFWKREDSGKSSKPAITEEKASSGRNGKSGSLFSTQAYQLTQEFDFGLVRKGSNGPSELNVHVDQIIENIHGRPVEPGFDNVSIENKTAGLPFDFMSVRQPESDQAALPQSAVGPKSFGPVAVTRDATTAVSSESAQETIPTVNLTSFDILLPMSLESLAVSSATVALPTSVDEASHGETGTLVDLGALPEAKSTGYDASIALSDSVEEDLLASFALPPTSGREVSDVDDWQTPQTVQGAEEPSLLSGADDSVAQGDPLFDDLIETYEDAQNEIQTFYPQMDEAFSSTDSLADTSLEPVDLDWAAVNDDLSFDDFALPNLMPESLDTPVLTGEPFRATQPNLDDDFNVNLEIDDATEGPAQTTFSDDLIVQANARLEESLANDPFGELPLHETIDLDIEPSFTFGEAVDDFGELQFEITTEASAVRPDAASDLPPLPPMPQPTFSWEAEAKAKSHHQDGFEGPQFASPEFAIEDLDTDLGDLGLDDFVLAGPPPAQADMAESPSHLQAALLAASAVVSDEPSQDFAAFECIDHLELDHQHQLLLGAQGGNHLGQPTWLLKGVTPDATVVLKTWDSPLAESSRIVQLQRANGPDGQGLYWVQVNDWQGVISNTLDEITLHTDLELLDNLAEGRTIA